MRLPPNWPGHLLFFFVFGFIVVSVVYLAATTPNPVRCVKSEPTDLIVKGSPIRRCLEWSRQ